MAHFRLTRQEAMSLADNIANALEVRRQDSPEVPPPYPEHRQVAKGMGIRRGRGQRGRPRQPVAVHYAVPPAHLHHAQRGAQASRRPLLPAAQGYENNQGTSYVPFTILDATGQSVPARYIKVHMTDNPYVEARMAMDGPVHRGEIHAAAVTDRLGRTPEIGPDELRLLDRSYPDWVLVDEAIAVTFFCLLHHTYHMDYHWDHLFFRHHIPSTYDLSDHSYLLTDLTLYMTHIGLPT
jgi:hypothetical protein